MTNHRTEILLCEPEYFSVDYVINPWMDVDNPVDKPRAWQQWRSFRDTLLDLGVKVHLIDPGPGLADMTFTGDGGIVLDHTFLSSNFRPEERRPEAELFRRWFAERGYMVKRLPEEVFFEGLGDIVIQGRTAVAAYGQRTSLEALDHIRSALLDLEWIAELELISPLYFHLGIALSLLDDKTGLYVPEAFSAASLETIRNLPHDMIPVGPEDAAGFAVNAVIVERNLVVNYCSPALRQELESREFRVIVCDCSEFVKSGGGTRCLVLPFAQ